MNKHLTLLEHEAAHIIAAYMARFILTGTPMESNNWITVAIRPDPGIPGELMGMSLTAPDPYKVPAVVFTELLRTVDDPYFGAAHFNSENIADSYVSPEDMGEFMGVFNSPDKRQVMAISLSIARVMLVHRLPEQLAEYTPIEVGAYSVPVAGLTTWLSPMLKMIVPLTAMPISTQKDIVESFEFGDKPGFMFHPLEEENVAQLEASFTHHLHAAIAMDNEMNAGMQ